MNDKKSQMSAEEMQNYIDSLISENARLKVANDALTEELDDFKSQLSAEELFEELGWTMIDDSSDSVAYGLGSARSIHFYKKDKCFVMYDGWDQFDIDVPLMKAIIKQYKELGWLE